MLGTPTIAPTARPIATVVPILALAVPSGLSRFCLLGLTLVSSAVVGQAGVDELAYLAIAASVQQTLLTPAYGLMAGLAPAAAIARARGQIDECARATVLALAMAVVVGVVIAVLLSNGEALLRLFHQPEAIARFGGRCLAAFAWGMPAMSLVQAGIIALEALGHPRIPLLILAGSNAVNFGLAMLLVGGYGSFPALGAEGSAIATSLVRWGMLGVTMAGLVSVLGWSPLRAALRPGGISMRPLRQMLAVGFPVACAAGFESGAFTALAAFAGAVGAPALAGFQICQAIYRVPYVPAAALGLASGVLVAAAIGRGDPAGVMRIGARGIQLSAVLLICASLALASFPEAAVTLFTDDATFAATITDAILITAVLILFDGAQGMLNNLLRGLSDSVIPSISQLVAFWGVAVPLGYFMAFSLGWGLIGVLTGLTIGLAVAAGFLLLRFHRHSVVAGAKLATSASS